MTPDEKRNLIYEVARAMQDERGQKGWDDLGDGARRSWVKRAERFLWNVPTLRRLIWGSAS